MIWVFILVVGRTQKDNGLDNMEFSLLSLLGPNASWVELEAPSICQKPMITSKPKPAYSHGNCEVGLGESAPDPERGFNSKQSNDLRDIGVPRAKYFHPAM